ncbi:MAG: hypothetical protein M1820_001435 [Bogoriella megaspora]|nr:MAG: hypothetical protein M1820_001435 [Bogoriella megaspora]
MSTICNLEEPLKPIFVPSSNAAESPKIASLIQNFNLQKHVEGGYFVETDRDDRRVPNPFLPQEALAHPVHVASQTAQGKQLTRAASTTIFYLITPITPIGCFHRNRGRTVHTLHRGRGRYVIIHADEVMGSYDEDDAKVGNPGKKARVESFIVGQNVEKGESLQWIVEGGKYKASYLLPDEEGGGKDSEGLLISETVVPGFEYEDHDFMKQSRLERLVTAGQAKELQWLMRKDAAEA